VIFCKDLLFIHIPKTGGMSVSQYLLKLLPKPVYYAQPTPDDNIRDKGILQIPGKRHESLEEARKVVAEYGFEVRNFPLILAILRNPYSLEVSRYAYLRAGHPWDRGPNQQLALMGDFETFAKESFYHGGPSKTIESYLLLDGKLPENLEIVRFEELIEGMEKALRRIGIEGGVADFPWVNRSQHGDHRSYYTEGAEEAVYRRYKWVFDHGFYERMDPSQFSGAAETFPRGSRLPTVGPVRTVGPPLGFWPDSWVGPILRFRVSASQEIGKLTIEGRFPRQLGGKSKFVLTINRQEFVACFDGRDSFAWTVPCRIMPNTETQLELATSCSWCPKQIGISKDARQLSFQLVCVVFERELQAASVEDASHKPS
jgi:hypothetical protein